MKSFYSRGKLLLTGEYAILDGAKGLALPTKLGQWLTVEETKSGVLDWFAYGVDGNCWLAKSYSLDTLLQKNNEKDILLGILAVARKRNPSFLTGTGYRVKTYLEFPRLWGLGTSSTLINNIALWAKIDPYKLLWESFGGSGYDIACASAKSPLVYRVQRAIPEVLEISFRPEYLSQLYFVYLNKKQDSKEGIRMYRNSNKDKKVLVEQLDSITDRIVSGVSFLDFCEVMQQHENLIGSFLEIPTAKEQWFSSFKGTVKSLGAWGGDFVLVMATEDPSDYFRSKGFYTTLPFNQLIP